MHCLTVTITDGLGTETRAPPQPSVQMTRSLDTESKPANQTGVKAEEVSLPPVVSGMVFLCSLVRHSRETPAGTEVKIFFPEGVPPNQLCHNIKIYQFILVTLPDQLNQAIEHQSGGLGCFSGSTLKTWTDILLPSGLENTQQRHQSNNKKTKDPRTDIRKNQSSDALVRWDEPVTVIFVWALKRHIVVVEHTKTTTTFSPSPTRTSHSSGSGAACTTGGISFQKEERWILRDVIQHFLVCSQSSFTPSAPSFSSPLRASLSLQLTMSTLFIFKEAAWVPIRHESSGVEMEAVTVHEGDIGLSPLVDFTAGPPALLPPLHQRQWSLWHSLKEKMEGRTVLVVLCALKAS